MSSIFSQIIERKLPAEIVWESETVIAIKDIQPKAPVHLLIIPKKEVPDLQSLQEEDLTILQEVVKAAQILAKEFGIEKGYRLLTNCGVPSGQTVFHLHFHLLGGKPLENLV